MAAKYQPDGERIVPPKVSLIFILLERRAYISSSPDKSIALHCLKTAVVS